MSDPNNPTDYASQRIRKLELDLLQAQARIRQLEERLTVLDPYEKPVSA